MRHDLTRSTRATTRFAVTPGCTNETLTCNNPLAHSAPASNCSHPSPLRCTWRRCHDSSARSTLLEAFTGPAADSSAGTSAIQRHVCGKPHLCCCGLAVNACGGAPGHRLTVRSLRTLPNIDTVMIRRPLLAPGGRRCHLRASDRAQLTSAASSIDITASSVANMVALAEISHIIIRTRSVEGDTGEPAWVRCGAATASTSQTWELG